MFYHKETNTYIHEGNPFTLNDVVYPSNWLYMSSPSEKAKIGITEVVTEGTPEDNRYFFVTSSLENGVLRIINTPKNEDQLAEIKKSENDAEVNRLETNEMLPRVLREFMILQYETIAKQKKIDPLEIYGYKKVKELDDTIKQLLGKKE
jgi:hypothetical protein